MFSIILATHDSERALVPTLAALVPGATAGIVREVIVTDGGSRDDTEKVADIAGCRFLVLRGPEGARLKAAAESARGDWLMFIRPGAVPAFTWIDDAFAFIEQTGADERAAIFAAAVQWVGIWTLFRNLTAAAAAARQAVLIRKSFYLALGGHADVPSPESSLLRRIGRRRLVRLRTTITSPGI
jgi:glycosyltransferase involved in cell wall biosynthesis